MMSLAPDFVIIALGFIIGGRIADSGWRQIDALCFFVLYPALLFTAAAQRPVSIDALATIGLAACLVVTAGFILSIGVTRLSKEPDPQTRGGIRQNAWRFNTALGFVAVTTLPAEATAVLAIIIGLAIPLANLFAILTIAGSQKHSAGRLAREVVLNPFLLASAAGLLAGLLGNPLPDMLMASLDKLATAAIPIVLLSIGAALSQSRWRPIDPYTMAITAIKVMVLPLLVLLFILLTGQRGIVPATLLLFAALPTASAAHVLAGRYGGDRSTVAVAVMQSTALGLFTLPFWSAIASRIVNG